MGSAFDFESCDPDSNSTARHLVILLCLSYIGVRTNSMGQTSDTLDQVYEVYRYYTQVL